MVNSLMTQRWYYELAWRTCFRHKFRTGRLWGQLNCIRSHSLRPPCFIFWWRPILIKSLRLGWWRVQVGWWPSWNPLTNNAKLLIHSSLRLLNGSWNTIKWVDGHKHSLVYSIMLGTGSFHFTSDLMQCFFGVIFVQILILNEYAYKLLSKCKCCNNWTS